MKNQRTGAGMFVLIFIVSFFLLYLAVTSIIKASPTQGPNPRPSRPTQGPTPSPPTSTPKRTPAPRPSPAVPSIAGTDWTATTVGENNKSVYRFLRGGNLEIFHSDSSEDVSLGTWKQNGVVVEIKLFEERELWTINGNRMAGSHIGRNGERSRLTATKGDYWADIRDKERRTATVDQLGPVQLGNNARQAGGFGRGYADWKGPLDTVAAGLQEHPNWVAHIIVYIKKERGTFVRKGKTSTYDNKTEAVWRAWRSKNYLVNERGIDATRIFSQVTIAPDGDEEEFLTKLFIVPNESVKTAPTPTKPRDVTPLASGWIKTMYGPIGKKLAAVFFIDSERGWIAGSSERQIVDRNTGDNKLEIVPDSGVIRRTVNGGGNWMSYPAPTNEEINDIYFLSKDEGFFLAGGDVFMTRNGGLTWIRSLHLDVKDFQGGGWMRLLKIKFLDKKSGWILGRNRRLGSQDLNLLFYTNDGGVSWSRTGKLPDTLNYNSMNDFDFIDEKRGWIVSSGELMWRTEDGGHTWREQNPIGRDGSGMSLKYVDFRDSKNGIAVGDVILLTSDGGGTWRRIGSRRTPYLNSVKLENNIGWAVGSYGEILRTPDGGQTWESEESHTKQDLNGLFITTTDVWAVGNDGIVLRYPRK